MPTSSSPALSLARVSAAPLTVHHRGFALTLPGGTGRYGVRAFGFEIRHQGLLLHASRADYSSAAGAERAARRFVDEALSVFDFVGLDPEAGT